MARTPKKNLKSNESSPGSSKKSVVFNKKKYRDTIYNPQKIVLNQALKRKTEFLREIKKDPQVSKQFKKSIIRDTRGQNINKKSDRLQDIVKERATKKEENKRKALEKQEAIKKSKQKRLEIYKKMNKRTKKGQPVMKDRMEILLQKIQASVK